MIEFLDPIMPGLGKDEFLKLLEERVETNTNRLIEEGRAWDRAHSIARPTPALPAVAKQDPVS